MNKIFLRFTIQGDNLDLSKIKQDIYMQEHIWTYAKGQIYPHKIKVKATPQKTNRWVYATESTANEKLNTLLKRVFKELKPCFDQIKYYTKRYYSLMDIVIYVEEKTSMFNANLSKENLRLLNLINTKLSITFVDF